MVPNALENCDEAKSQVLREKKTYLVRSESESCSVVPDSFHTDCIVHGIL